MVGVLDPLPGDVVVAGDFARQPPTMSWNHTLSPLRMSVISPR